MTKPIDDHQDDFDLFRQSMGDVKPMGNDKVTHQKVIPTPKKTRAKQERKLADHYFSDSYHPVFPSDGPMRWTRDDIDTFELKKLRRGEYSPELLLDLHGYTLAEARHELIALINACKQQHVPCASVMTGIGTGVLKQKVPAWLCQHPDVLAFHQAPLEWGGNGALLILVEIPDSEMHLR
ncbi:endonuclease SmrB [Ferrimonas lipolytica]|uniref:Ribosome rescue factor SmrB n=1 Tax=Ferrimonas lipolytica TaxID=2724191 RepID=A0A6H1UEG5_9GAMM|nr:endonuclease SmrB [Ferrimonas lipolytica]QIZ77218.1 endonuclease SmrB [Ferrimonas lipolytica]